jgi:hypothetical protein
MSNSHRWLWVALALTPGLLSDLVFVVLALFSLNHGDNSDSVASVATGAFYAALCVPFAMPVYLYFLGRRYVRAVHGGFKSAIPFAALYTAANLVLWACGCLLVLAQMGIH